MQGFQQWFQAFQLVLVALILVAVPCFVTIVLGGRVINELGNFPTKWIEIQKSSVWKVLVTQIVSLALLLGFFNAIL
jgi:hypothetical protein